MDELEALRLILEKDKYGWITSGANIDSFSGELSARVIRAKLETASSFYREYSREPVNSGSLFEIKASAGLAKIRDEGELGSEIIEADEFGLVSKELVMPGQMNNLNRLLESDLIRKIFEKDDMDSSIFDIKNVSYKAIDQERSDPDKIGEMTACLDFDVFKSMFKSLHYDLKNGAKVIHRHENIKGLSSSLSEGDFYLLRGMLIFIDHVGDSIIDSIDGDKRLMIIFENGTKSSMLLKSLIKRIHEDDSSATITNIDGTKFNSKRIKLGGHSDPRMQVEKSTGPTGFIYIAKTRNEKLCGQYKNLYKIGLTRRDLDQRIAEAENDPAFLMSKADLVKSIPVNGLSITSVESAIHALFQDVRLEIEVTVEGGRKHRPREWFLVPISEINSAIELIQNSEIHLYKYDPVNQEIVERDPVSDW